MKNILPKSRTQNIIGQRFGRLVVEYELEPKTLKNGKHERWMMCRCDCGKNKAVRLYCLTSGTTRSCGCLNIKKDIIGKTFGHWTVLYETEGKYDKQGKHVRYCFCRCICGTEREVSVPLLVSGQSKSCGCLNKDISKQRRENFIGRKFGRLTVIDEAEPQISPNGQKRRMLWCLCECGEKMKVRSDSLKDGSTVSCGCYSREISVSIGKKKKLYNTYDLESYEYGVGYTNTGIPFYFDKEDFDKIKDYRWYYSNGYIESHVSNSNKRVRLHRLVMKITDPHILVDHIGHDKTDNRKCNLRIVNHSKNSENSKLKKNNKSGYPGIFWLKKEQKWWAKIKVNYEDISLGRFKNKEDAIAARKAAEEKYFGEFSYDASMKLAEQNKIKD